MRKKRIVVNMFTVIRIFMAGLFAFAAAAGAGAWSLLSIYGIAILTDLLDGKLARKWGAATKKGAAFDAAADAILVTAAFAALYGSGISHGWMIAVAAGKYAEFTITSAILAKHRGQQQSKLVFDRLGRGAAISMMGLPPLAVCANALAGAQMSSWIVFIACLGVCIPAVISSVSRVTGCVREAATVSAARNTAEGSRFFKA